MFQKLPAFLGKALDRVRAGTDKLLLNEEARLAPETIEVTSPAFENGRLMPIRFTADGEGVSPPLSWSNLPAETRQVLVVVEDPDIPAPHPFIHLIAIFDSGISSVAEGGLVPGPSVRLGRHSMGGTGWLPNDPPPGHGPHHYLFQVFALNRAIEWGEKPGRSDVKTALKGAVIAKGALVGVYERAKAT